MNINSSQLNKTNLDIKHTNNLTQQPSELGHLVRRIWTVVKFVFGTVLIVLPCLRRERTVYIYATSLEDDEAARKFLFWNSPWRYRLNIISPRDASDTSGPDKRVISVLGSFGGASEEKLIGNGYQCSLNQEQNRKILMLMLCPFDIRPNLRGHGWPELLSKGLIFHPEDWRNEITDDFFN